MRNYIPFYNAEHLFLVMNFKGNKNYISGRVHVSKNPGVDVIKEKLTDDLIYVDRSLNVLPPPYNRYSIKRLLSLSDLAGFSNEAIDMLDKVFNDCVSIDKWFDNSLNLEKPVYSSLSIHNSCNLSDFKRHSLSGIVMRNKNAQPINFYYCRKTNQQITKDVMQQKLNTINPSRLTKKALIKSMSFIKAEHAYSLLLT